MDKREAITYLRERLREIPALSKLKYNNNEYRLWIQTIRGVVENVFGQESYESQKLAQTYQISGSHEEARQRSYKYNLKMREIAILSIIQTWETIGLEPEIKESLEPPESFNTRSNWGTIEREFGITKNKFGRKINFVSDGFQRSIIFRDVEHSFVLANLDFPKPAVILAGSVIEELLRLYLEYKNISPLSDKFDGYIKTCEQHGLLKDSVSRLSHAVRQFRNLVHLSAEKTKKHTISKATAIGAFTPGIA